MLAWTVPGSTSSLPLGSEGFGWVVLTVAMAASSVAFARFAAARWAEMMFQTTKATATTAITAPTRVKPFMWVRCGLLSGGCIVESDSGDCEVRRGKVNVHAQAPADACGRARPRTRPARTAAWRRLP